MHIIMYHELDSIINNFENYFNKFENISFDWSSVFNDEDKVAFDKMYNILLNFYKDIKEYIKFLKYSIGHTNLDKDKESFRAFLESILDQRNDLFNRYEKYKKHILFLDEEFKKIYSEIDSKNQIEQLIIARDAVYVTRFMKCFYLISECFLKSEQLVLIYTSKLEDSFI